MMRREGGEERGGEETYPSIAESDAHYDTVIIIAFLQ